MRNVIAKRIRAIFAVMLGVAMVFAAPLRPLAHESPVDHVDRAIRIWIDGNTLFLRYQLQLSERAAMMQLKTMDADGDGAVSDSERVVFFGAFAERLAKDLHVQLGERPLELKPAGRVELLPQCRQVFLFSSPTGALARGTVAGKLSDEFSRNYPGVYRWDGAKEKAKSEPRVVVSEAPKSQEAAGHPAVLVLKFEVVVP